MSSVSRQQGPHPLEERHVPADQRLAELLGESGERGDASVDGGHIADLEVGHDPEAVAEQLQDTVTALNRELDDRVGVVTPGHRVRRPGEGVIDRGQGLRDQRRVADLLREVEGVGRPLPRRRHRLRRGGRDRQARQQHRPQLGGADGQELECVGDERGVFVTRDRDLPGHRSRSHAQHRSGHGFRRVDAPRQLRASKNRARAASRSPASSRHSPSSTNSAARRIGSEPAPRPAWREAPRGLVEGEHPPGPVRGLLPVRRRGLRVPEPGQLQMVGDDRVQATGSTARRSSNTAAARRCSSARRAESMPLEDDVADQVVS